MQGTIIEVDFGATQMHVRVSYEYNGTVVEKVLYFDDMATDNAVIEQAVIDQAPYMDLAAIDEALALKIVQDAKSTEVMKLKPVDVPEQVVAAAEVV